MVQSTFYIDFQRSNDVSTFDVYPMPKVVMLLEVIGEAQVLSTIDLMKGYWQIPLVPEAKQKTAFASIISRDGTGIRKPESCHWGQAPVVGSCPGSVRTPQILPKPG